MTSGPVEQSAAVNSYPGVTYDGYNDAWDTPGWTSQNMSYPPPEQKVVYFPSDIDMVTISGHFRDGDGGRANGWFSIDNGKTILTHDSTKETILPIKARVEIKNGTFSVTIPATDAATLNALPANWGYHIYLALDGRKFAELNNVALPAATPDVDIFDLLQNAGDI